MDAVQNQVSEFEFDDLYALENQVSDGKSYDGFINHTDGFVYRQAYYTPRRDNPLTFKGFDSESEKRANEVQELHDSYVCNTDNSTDSYWYDNIRGTDNENRWTDSKDFVEWYNNFDFNADNSDDDESLYYEVQEYNDDWFSESPAFVGVAVRLYDPDNHRSGNDEKSVCVVESFFNDDFGYGRESSGWGKYKHKHCIYQQEFDYDGLKDLQSQLAEHLPKAFESIGQ